MLSALEEVVIDMIFRFFRWLSFATIA